MSHASDVHGAALSRRELLRAGGLAAPAALLAAACRQPAGQQEAARPESAPARVQEVVWSCYTLGDARNKILDDTAQAAQKALPGVRLTLDIQPGQGYWDKLQTMVVGGSAPDIVVNQVNWVQAGAARNIFVALDDYMAKDRIRREDYNDYKSWLWKGKLYAIPFQALGETIFISRRTFDEAGLKLPDVSWTFQDMLELARRLTKGEGEQKQWGIQYGYGSIEMGFGTIILNFGGKVLNDARDRALYGEDARALEAAQFYADWRHRYLVHPRPSDIPPGSKPFIEIGRGAMYQTGFFYVANIYAALREDLWFTSPPRAATNPSCAVGSNAWSITTSSKVKDAAWKVLAYLVGEEAQTTWAPGGTPALAKVAASPAYLKNYPGLEKEVTHLIQTWNRIGRDYFITPDADDWWRVANRELAPMYTGEKSPVEAMRASAEAVNREVFAVRPPELR